MSENIKIGMIGAGNMGGAIVKGYTAANPSKAQNVYVFNPLMAKAEKLAEACGINPCGSAAETAEKCKIIIMAVKPNQFENAVQSLGAAFTEDKILVSIAAGISLEQMETLIKKYTPAQKGLKIVRVMPNTPALVGEGMSGLSRNAAVSDEEFALVKEIFEAVGKAEEINEKLMDAVVGVSGSSPAYVYMLIEALADGAVIWGMPRNQAYTFAAQAVLGSAKMVLETGIHPGSLKDMVCSPGGATIDAVKILEESGFRSGIIKAVDAAADKSKKLGE